MVREDTGRLFRQGSAKTLFLSLPSKLSLDSNFPFNQNEYVRIRIEGKRLVIEKIK